VETGDGGGRWALPAAGALTLLLILFLILRRKRASSNLNESLE
ncbi:MAG: LPXTG cell wall anchor domain-containing protein, partial [Chloroflexi bacterium]|nr:LPXTG cell wall anchor domain-containing protein [Chloroflexota bacterium]NOG75454.1 LPXTG cell wall anchor domain-containing protein [Chloroflexota bacterium]